MAEISEPYKNQNPQDINDSSISHIFNILCIVIRKVLIIITICIGTYFYILSFHNFCSSINGNNIIYINSIYASLITLFCPIWTQSFDEIISELKKPSKQLNILCLLIALLCLRFSIKYGNRYAIIIYDFLIILCGLWLAFSYTDYGKQMNKDCEKCCNQIQCDISFCLECCFPRYGPPCFDCDCLCGDCPDCDCGDCLIM